MNDTTHANPPVEPTDARDDIVSNTITEQLDTTSLQQAMLSSFKASFSEDWAEIRIYAKEEAQRLSSMLLNIHQMIITGETTEERAKILLKIQRNSEASYLLALRGMNKAAVDSAVQKALIHVQRRVNLAVGFDLL